MASNDSDADFDTHARESIPANVRMISGCKDSQTSADVFDVSTFDAPGADPGPGGAGGACTNALLSVVNSHAAADDGLGGLTLAALLESMRGILKEKRFTQVPQLSSSRKLDLADTWSPLLEGGTGVNRALMIGINYVGTNAELRGCHNDVIAMQEYLVSQGFETENMKVLLDDGVHESPTYDGIKAGFAWLVTNTKEGDNIFVHYSGHGGHLADNDGDEKDGRDETLCPVDYAESGQIRDDLILRELVIPLPRNSQLTALMDCCHSGTIFDLPYQFVADEASSQTEGNEMTANPTFDWQRIGKLANVALEMFNEGASISEIALKIKDDLTEEDKKVAMGCLSKCTIV